VSVRPRTRNRLGVPVAIFTVFAAPLALALLVYWRPDWQPADSLARGQLVHPPQPLVSSQLSDLEGRPLDPGLFRGRWTLLYWSADGCAQRCRSQLNALLRICRAEAKGQGRLQRVLAVPELPADLAQTLRKADAGLRLVLAERHWTLPDGQVYLIDPLGNLVLHYPAPSPPRDIAKDLARLLRLSGIG